jgi:hypothetical protein
MNKAGRVVLGEPHSESRSGTRTAVRTAKSAAMTGTWRDFLPEGEVTPRIRAAALGGVALLAGVIVWWFLPTPTLEERAKAAGIAFKDGDKSTLKSMALRSTSKDLEGWYNVVHPRLEAKMKEWGASDVTVEVMPDMEDTKEGEKVSVMITPGPITAETAHQSMYLMLYMKKRSGQWWINGKATVNSAAGGTPQFGRF